jgi:hypothetical protein
MTKFILLLLFLLSCKLIAAENPWEVPSCEFQKTDLKLSPEKLVSEFVKRNLDGEFTQRSGWLDKASACPGHLPGWDEASVVIMSKVKKISETKDHASINIVYSVAGVHGTFVDRGKPVFGFTPDAKGTHEVPVAIEVIRTPYGWKMLNNPGPFISPQTALTYKVGEKQLRAGDKPVLEQLAKSPPNPLSPPSASITVPDWLQKMMITRQTDATESILGGRRVFLLRATCCDIPSEVFDQKGKKICTLEGGFANIVDPKCKDFEKDAKFVRAIELNKAQ